jgi:hypothetical protein
MKNVFNNSCDNIFCCSCNCICVCTGSLLLSPWTQKVCHIERVHLQWPSLTAAMFWSAIQEMFLLCICIWWCYVLYAGRIFSLVKDLLSIQGGNMCCLTIGERTIRCKWSQEEKKSFTWTDHSLIWSDPLMAVWTPLLYITKLLHGSVGVHNTEKVNKLQM